MNIKKALIPCAGKGTRFLPATKEVPKELIPILNRPMIEFVVEEAIESGIDQIVFITASGKEKIADYFDRNLELETFLEKAGKHQLLEDIQNLSQKIEIITVRQKEQLGLGHALLSGKPITGDENFAVLLPDDLTFHSPAVTRQLIECFEKQKAKAVIGVMKIEPEQSHLYGVIDPTEQIDSKTTQMKGMVEKPNKEDAPSFLATPGRYIFSSQIYQFIESLSKGAGGEYQLTDAINEMCLEYKVLAYQFEGKRFDTGTLPGYLQATLYFAKQHPDLKDFVL